MDKKKERGDVRRHSDIINAWLGEDDLVDYVYRDGMVASNVTREWADATKYTPEGRGGHIRRHS